MKKILLCALISLVKGGYINTGASSSTYSNAVHHPAVVAAPAPVLLRHAAATASSSVNVNTNHATNSIASPLNLGYGLASVAAAPAVVHTRIEPYDPNPHYNFAYDVNDPHTGDSKNQHESRAGDVVRGQYSLQEPDGSRRTVDYSADPHSGFLAVVRRTVPAHPVQVAQTAHVGYYPQSGYVVSAH